MRTIDLGVAIERVRVVVGGARGGESELREAPLPSENPRAADHRLVLQELRIETDAALGEGEARRLGEQVSARVAARLGELQDRRAAAILDGRARGGRLRIGAVCARLVGDAADHATAGAIADELGAAVEREVSACLR